MGLLDKFLQRALNEQIKNLRKQIGSELYGKMLENVSNQPIYIGDDIESYINDGYLFNPTVYSVVSFIAQKASSIPWGVYEVKDEMSLKKYKSASPNAGLKRDIVRTKALVAIEEHELSGIFTKPNELQGWAEFIEQCVGFKLVTGNSYIHAIGPKNGLNAGIISEMWNLPSQAVMIVPGDKMQPIRGYKYLPDQQLLIPPEEVIHLKYWTPEYEGGSFLYGVSPIRAGRRVVTKSNSSYDASVASFQNMGARGILGPEPGMNVEPLTEEQQEFIEDRFKRKTGPNNAGKPLITAIPLRWQQTGMSPVDLQIIESDKMDLRTICNLYHVPSELFNDAANKTYSNTKEAGSAVYTNAVIPQLVSLRDAINAFIKPRYQGKIFIDFDTSLISELQEDMKYQAEALSLCWWVSPNEKREIMGFGVDEDNEMMNEYMIPAGIMPMSVDDPDPAKEPEGTVNDYE